MKVTPNISDIHDERWADPQVTWGLAPTMGFLHGGHLSLVRRARQENDRVAVSIFVNPIQFNDPGDLAAYPRDPDRDLGLLEEAGVDLVWVPTAESIYPPDYQTFVEVTEASRSLEGATRPGHFRGVTTVVAKLFNVFQPTRAYFGQKDAQQVVVIKQMVRDLHFNLEIVVCPIVREADGLAKSSRNALLSPDARRQATCLYQALLAGKDSFEQGERDAGRLRAAMREVIERSPLARPDYVSVAEPATLQELERVEDGALLSMAVFVDGVRLIDNMVL